jgi:hypothetical protein
MTVRETYKVEIEGVTRELPLFAVVKVDARVVCEAAVFTEGDSERWTHVVALGHLPVFY